MSNRDIQTQTKKGKRQTDKNRQKDKQTNKKTNKQTSKQTDKQRVASVCTECPAILLIAALISFSERE